MGDRLEAVSGCLEVGEFDAFPELYDELFAQPRTLLIRLQRNIGPNGTQPLPRAAQ